MVWNPNSSFDDYDTEWVFENIFKDTGRWIMHEHLPVATARPPDKEVHY